MNGIELVQSQPLGVIPGILTLVLMGVAMLVLAFYSKTKLVKNTHDFVIAGRKLGFGFGVAGLLSVWTWVVGILMPIAVTYSYGLSGLWWFAVPNGISVVAVVPFARKLKALMPHGYTISEFVAVRYDGAKLARVVVIFGILFGAIQAVIINLKGASLVVATIFGLDEGTVAVIASIAILTYTVLGGLWASVSTSTLMALLLLVPSAIVAVATLGHVGGADAVWQAVAAKGDGLLGVTRADAFENFGVTFTLGLITATIAGQEFWQVAWGLRENELGRTFFWGGGLYYPIALCLGVIGLVGIAFNVDLARDLGGDAAAIGPYLISHLGLPHWIIYLFVVIVLSACYSTCDGALAAVSSISAVDIIKPLVPNIPEKTLFQWTRLSMVITVIVSIAVVLSGIDFVSLLLGTSAIRGAILVPLILSIAWRKMNAAAFIWGTIAALVVGIPTMLTYGEVISTPTIVAVSTIVPIIIASFNRDSFDYRLLQRAQDI
ncbi:sodium:solute symporter [Leptolyngbya sp. FACHB-16]|uniref:sodium:solute symporter family transporter n=1 Tax=unclassified Leptolyngbya TaxID=2650499 RepID=UPI0016892A5E|nr:sodium:solute symporter [Leptolyngbya sp. FACHB-16]MBD2153812.1 sodium:solute symporter [Leptolyngbya sp. FACHB-16]